MTPASQTQMTIVTAPDYYISQNDRIVAIGDNTFHTKVKEELYKSWPDKPVTLCCGSFKKADSDWLFNVLGTAHFVIIELGMEFNPTWLIEWCADIPHVYYEDGWSTDAAMIAIKRPNLVANSMDVVVAQAIKALA